ncbi:Uncharacterized protein BC88300_02608 [Bacillus cytotoxicus]|uniref:hypothetical protein n=1 Tax=Bacillus cytotoxicus TaxID=580165 RepID=UPI000863F627|nr:hypothetical protein [Bacillus cytotoxicus]SCN38317.1 Uncharacterized protein BC88300_02608 [Bacillus cytotoxicus]
MPFVGRVVDLNRTENGITIQIPFDMLDNAGIVEGLNKVEVWREVHDGTICIRVATLCDICKKGARLYELDLGFAKRMVCAEDYQKITGIQPQDLDESQSLVTCELKER